MYFLVTEEVFEHLQGANRQRKRNYRLVEGEEDVTNKIFLIFIYDSYVLLIYAKTIIGRPNRLLQATFSLNQFKYTRPNGLFLWQIA